MPTTTRLSLRYPATSDSADVPRDIGNLASDLDNAAIFSKGTFAARPTSTVGSPGIDGRYYYATDNTTLYLDTGTSWVTVGGVSDGSVTADKLAAALANNVGANQTGVTNRSAMTVMTTERTTTALGASTDVTGASLSFTVASGSYVIVGYSAEVKSSDDREMGIFTAYPYVRVLAGSAVCNPLPLTYLDSSFNYYYEHGTIAIGTQTYTKVGGLAIFPAAMTGTGSVTFKFQMNSGSGRTVYVKNCYLTVTQVTF